MLSRAEAVRVQQLADRFEDAWQSGERPSLRSYLPEQGVLRHAALLELVITDLEYRQRRGEAATVEACLEAFPELQGDAELLRQLVGNGRGNPPPPPAGPPARLGKYVLQDVLGSGSCGTVYRATDTELGRVVAVKVPRQGSLAGRDEEERFFREARSAAQLQHPGVVAVYEAGRCAGTCYLVSEFIPGRTLAQQAALGRPPTRQAAELLAEVAEALQYAHARGVIHRDLKPSNILLDPEGRPHLGDFGLAKREAGENTLTATGQVLGTPAYMSPEQARGEAHQVDGRSDVYSLGVILYELLAGELPFRGNARMLLRQVLEEEPPPPRRLNDRIPRDLETICLKCMQKDPRRRYATAGALAAELRRFLEGRPIQARPVGPGGRLLRWCRRKPAQAGFLAVLLFGLAGVSWQWWRAEDQRRQAVAHAVEADLQRSRAEDNFQQAHQLANEFLEFGKQPLLQTRAANPARRQLLETCLKYYQGFLAQHGDDPALRAEANHCLVWSAYLTFQLAPDSEAIQGQLLAAYDQGRATWQQLLEEQPTNTRYRVELAQTNLCQGELHVSLGKPAQALPFFTQALDFWLQLVQEGAPSTRYRSDLANTYAWLGMVHRRLNRSAEACALLEQAIGIWQDLEGAAPGANSRAGLITTSYQLGEELVKTGKTAAALDAYEKVLRLSDPPLLNGADNPDLWYPRARSYYAIGKIRENTNQPLEAIPVFHRAADLFEQLLRQQPAKPVFQLDLGNSYQHLGDLYRRTGELSAAIEYYQKALPVRERHWLGEPYLGRRKSLVETCCSLGRALQQAGRPEEALAAYRRAVDPQRITLKEGTATERRRLSDLYRDVASALEELGQPSEAEAIRVQRQALNGGETARP
jgi:tetratricopeptide (TPR) repeat protein